MIIDRINYLIEISYGATFIEKLDNARKTYEQEKMKGNEVSYELSKITGKDFTESRYV
jgi:hypothetical protein